MNFFILVICSGLFSFAATITGHMQTPYSSATLKSHMDNNLPANAKPGECYKRFYPPTICYPSQKQIEKETKDISLEWIKVLCEYQKTEELCEQIKFQLWTRGYLKNQSQCSTEANGTYLNKEVAEAFFAFQSENNLKPSLLDLETLDLLGVFY